MKVYVECGDDVRELMQEQLEANHGEVAELKPQIGLWFVEYDSETVEKFEKKIDKLKKKRIVWSPPPVLKLHGVAAAATVKVTSYADRVQGKPDVVITIDGDAWKSYDEKQRAALLDHELEHLVPKLREGSPYADDLGRPVLWNKPHDWDLSGFVSVTERHGIAAIEVKSAINFITDSTGQMVMQFGGMRVMQIGTDKAKDGDTVPLSVAMRKK